MKEMEPVVPYRGKAENGCWDLKAVLTRMSLGDLQGPAVVHVGPSDWCAVRRVGEAFLPAGDRLLHLRSHPTDETQPLV